jgi:cell division protein FtsI/penicillin-binding protein 2
MGKSANVIFAKLTQRYLSPEALKHAAARFHFNREISFPVPTDVSLAAVPDSDEFRFAQTGAGFGDVYLSPLHGALLASVAANKGVWKDAVLFDDPNAPPQPGEQVLSPEVARDLTTLMEATVTKGTARRIFRERGMGVPGAVGKTGTLADRAPFRDYSWFVGFAPKDNPKVAVAALIVNEPIWRIRATWLGREAMRLGLARLPPGSLVVPPREEPPEPQEETPSDEESSQEESSPVQELVGAPTAAQAPVAAETTGP